MLKNKIVILLIRLIIIIIFLYVFFIHILSIHISSSTNMNPSIKPGDLVIIYNLNKNYVRGDVILTSNKQLFRIIAAYKDEITIDENNRLLINGQVMEEEIYFDTFINKESKVKYPLKMKKNEYFVLNDYRMDDKDSRYFGSIKLSDIKGLVISNIRIRGI